MARLSRQEVLHVSAVHRAVGDPAVQVSLQLLVIEEVRPSVVLQLQSRAQARFFPSFPLIYDLAQVRARLNHITVRVCI